MFTVSDQLPARGGKLGAHLAVTGAALRGSEAEGAHFGRRGLEQKQRPGKRWAMALSCGRCWPASKYGPTEPL